jgi:hypothetical protein
VIWAVVRASAGSFLESLGLRRDVGRGRVFWFAPLGDEGLGSSIVVSDSTKSKCRHNERQK